MFVPYPPMTTLEKNKVDEVLAWDQPECPGCGSKMSLGLEETGRHSMWESARKRERYRAWYWCTRCRIWRTDAVNGYTANMAAENAYKLAKERHHG